jgi:hypothetical protein
MLADKAESNVRELRLPIQVAVGETEIMEQHHAGP